MSAEHLDLVTKIAACLAGAAPLVYLLFALVCVFRWKPRTLPADMARPPITILKPVCGLEADLYDNLKTFCQQRYPAYQIIFGVQRADDESLPVLRRLISEVPGLDVALVTDGKGPSLNPKVCNLINMVRLAKHDLIIVADSDVRVGETFLDAVADCLQDERVGVVSCPYVGQARSGLVSRLGALSINEWFMPSVFVARCLQPLNFCLGASIAIRRRVLEQIGGFEALRSYLADDYMLGRLVREAGYRVELVDYTVGTSVTEMRLGDLLRHEVRWAKTIWTMEPVGHVFSVVTLFVPMAVLAALLSRHLLIGAGVLAAGTVLRVLVGYAVEARLGVRERFVFWLAPVRDAMSFVVWVASFVGRTVAWRGSRFTIQRDGRMAPVDGPIEPVAVKDLS